MRSRGFFSVLAAFGLMAALGTTSAKAVMVTYTTQGYFNNVVGQTSISNNGIVIQFNGTPGLVNLTTINPSFGSLGDFQTFGGAGTGTFSSAFTLVINQTTPTPGTDTLAGTVQGTLTFDASGVLFTPNDSQAMIGDVFYRLLQPFYALVPSTTNGGLTTIQAQIGANVVPEPSTFAMAGTAGLLSLVALRRRRKATA